MGALQTVVESRVLHYSEDLPQQHQADQHRSPNIDPARQAVAPTRCAPGIDDKDTYRRHENVRQERGPYSLFGESRCGAGRIVRLAWSRRLLARGQLCGEGTQGYKHVPQRPAYIGERTRGIGFVQRPVSEVTVCYHDKGQTERQQAYGWSESVLTGSRCEYYQAGYQHDTGQRV